MKENNESMLKGFRRKLERLTPFQRTEVIIRMTSLIRYDLDLAYERLFTVNQPKTRASVARPFALTKQNAEQLERKLIVRAHSVMTQVIVETE